MYPNIVIGSIIIPSWYALLILGAMISTSLAVYLRPPNFPLNRKEITIVAALLVILGLLGARVLHLLLQGSISAFNLRQLFSFRGGYAYFGALVFSVGALLIYSHFKKVNFLLLADYAMPFLMLSQMFVRIGCLAAGCCYGKPTSQPFGLAFKTVDGLARHPTQVYEAVLLFLIYVISRRIYKRRADRRGLTLAATLIMYGLGRFFVEYFRADSRVLVLDLTQAQVSCLLVTIVGMSFLLSPKIEKS